jgi:hypothetical protein
MNEQQIMQRKILLKGQALKLIRAERQQIKSAVLQKSLFATLGFLLNGKLKEIFLSAETEQDQAILQKGLYQLIRPPWFQRLHRMMKHDK